MRPAHSAWIKVINAMKNSYRAATPEEIAEYDDICIICHDDLKDEDTAAHTEANGKIS